MITDENGNAKEDYVEEYMLSFFVYTGGRQQSLSHYRRGDDS